MKKQESGFFWVLAILLTGFVAAAAAVAAITLLHRRREEGCGCENDDWNEWEEEDQLVHFDADPDEYDIEQEADPEAIKF